MALAKTSFCNICNITDFFFLIRSKVQKTLLQKAGTAEHLTESRAVTSHITSVLPLCLLKVKAAM